MNNDNNKPTSKAVEPASNRPTRCALPKKSEPVCTKGKTKITVTKIMIGDSVVEVPSCFIEGDRLLEIKCCPSLYDRDSKTAAVLANLLNSLVSSAANGLALSRFIEKPAIYEDHLEYFIQLLIDIRFQLPSSFEPFPKNSKSKEAVLTADSNVIGLLMEKIRLCTNLEDALEKCRKYTWFLEAHRRAASLAHATPGKGLQSSYLKCAAKVARENPQYAFIWSPTTLHENTLLQPAAAKLFTCDPLLIIGPQKLAVSHQYKSVISEETLQNAEICGPKASMCNNPAVALIRMGEELAKVNIGTDFPWVHPTLAHTGVLCAGGMPSGALCNDQVWTKVRAETDVDLFVYGPDEEASKSMAQLVLNYLEKVGGAIDHHRAVFRAMALQREVQIIVPGTPSPLGVLANFDSTHIQVGYQAGRFVASPGYCFFSPHGQSLLIRSKIRFQRMVKMLARGFTPLSDERGHTLTPGNAFFSPRWPLGIALQGTFDEEWIESRTNCNYFGSEEVEGELSMKELRKGAEKAELSVAEYVKTLTIKNPERYKTVRAEWVERAAENRAKRPYLVEIRDQKAAAEEGKKKPLVWSNRISEKKPNVEWVPVAAADALKDYCPAKQTMAQGFDAYTQGANNSLPLPPDGKVDGLYTAANVLLRNVRILPPQPTYNLAAPGEKPLEASHRRFSRVEDSYPGDRYYTPSKDIVRTIEGVFVLAEPLADKEIDARLEAEEARYIARQRKHLEKQRKNLKTHIALLEQKETSKTIVAEMSKNKDEEEESDGASTERVAAFRKELEEVEAKLADPRCKIPASEPSERDRRRVAVEERVEYGDLHRFVEEPAQIGTVALHELPELITTLGKGNTYHDSEGNEITRRSKMVKVRATVTLSTCSIIGFDDLMMPKTILDGCPNYRYNCLVKLSNLDDWVIPAHKHMAIAQSGHVKEVVMDVIRAELEKEKFGKKISAKEFLRAVRKVANEKSVEDRAMKGVCPLLHAHEGLPGHMPVLFVTRFYVTRCSIVKK